MSSSSSSRRPAVQRLRNVLRSRNRQALQTNPNDQQKTWTVLQTEKNRPTKSPTVPTWWNHAFLKVGIHPRKGRYLYTTKDLTYGQLVLDEKPQTAPTARALQKKIQLDSRFADLDGGHRKAVSKNAWFVKNEHHLFLGGSFFSHSCRPNAALNESNQFVVIAKEGVKAGAEITVSYRPIDTLGPMTKAQRREELSHWFPQCECLRCKNDD